MPKLSLKQIAYQTIRKKILDCEYEPNLFLNEDFLCSQLEMSRTPVRDALSRLEQENLIHIIPKKGFFVTGLSLQDIQSVFEGRLLIEPYIVAKYCGNLSEENLNEMKEILSKHEEFISDNKKESFSIDSAFHQIMISQCPNRYLTEALASIHLQNMRLRVLSGRENKKRQKETLREHEAVYEALKKHDAELASQLIKKHLENARTSAYDTFLNKPDSI